MNTYNNYYRFQCKKSFLFRLQRAVCVWVGRVFIAHITALKIAGAYIMQNSMVVGGVIKESKRERHGDSKQV